MSASALDLKRLQGVRPLQHKTILAISESLGDHDRNILLEILSTSGTSDERVHLKILEGSRNQYHAAGSLQVVDGLAGEQPSSQVKARALQLIKDANVRSRIEEHAPKLGVVLGSRPSEMPPEEVFKNTAQLVHYLLEHPENDHFFHQVLWNILYKGEPKFDPERIRRALSQAQRKTNHADRLTKLLAMITSIEETPRPELDKRNLRLFVGQAAVIKSHCWGLEKIGKLQKRIGRFKPN